MPGMMVKKTMRMWKSWMRQRSTGWMSRLSVKRLGRTAFSSADNGSVALYLFQEDKGVVALVDEWENVTDMRLTLDGYHRNNETKDVFKKRYAETRDGLRADSALHHVGVKIRNQDVMEILRGKWEPFIADALKNGCEAQARSTEQGTVLELTDKRTGVSMEVCEQDPEPGYHGATVTRFADEIAGKEFQAIIREAGLTESDVSRYMVPTESLSAAGQKILAGSRFAGTAGSTHKTGGTFLNPCGYGKDLACGSEGESDLRVKGDAYTGTYRRVTYDCGSLSAKATGLSEVKPDGSVIGILQGNDVGLRPKRRYACYACGRWD